MNNVNHFSNNVDGFPVRLLYRPQDAAAHTLSDRRFDRLSHSLMKHRRLHEVHIDTNHFLGMNIHILRDRDY